MTATAATATAQRQRFTSESLLAIAPAALGMMFDVFDDPEDRRANDTSHSDYTVVRITGPLSCRECWWDSYPAIRERCESACGSAAPVIVLRISSPGGDAAGCMELARELRAMFLTSGKTVIAYVDEQACSAAYALASAVTHGIYLSSTALVGSIGVIVERTDYSAANSARGVVVTLITSGARKGDGNPDVAMTPEELAAQQRIVDSVAGVFFVLVRDMRGLEAQPLEAGVFHGADAVTQHVADYVMSFDAAVARAINGEGDGMDNLESVRAALQRMIDAGGADAAGATRALAALDEKPKPKPDDAGDDADASAAADGDAPGDDADDDDDDAEDDKVAAKAAYRLAAKATADLHALRADIARERTAAERARLIASRPDLPSDVVATFATAPLSVVRDLVKTLPRIAQGADAGAALAAQQPGVAPTRGDDAAAGAPRLPPAEKAKLDRQMGLTSATTTPVTNTAHKLILGLVQ